MNASVTLKKYQCIKNKNEIYLKMHNIMENNIILNTNIKY